MAVKAKVARILSEYQLALNAGSEAGVRVGDIVTIHDEVHVNDPDSGESLGSVLVNKLNLKVTVVQARMSVAVVTERVGGGDALSLFFASTQPLKRISGEHELGDYKAVVVEVGDPATVQHAPEATPPPKPAGTDPQK